MDVRSFFVADAQAPPVEQPVEAGFDDVAVSAKAAAMFAVALGDHGDDAQGTQRSKDLVLGVVSCIGQKSVGTPTWSALRLFNGRNRLHQRHRHLGIVNVGTGVGNGQRRTVLVGDQMALRTRFAAIRGIRPGLCPPKMARTEQLSRTPFDQSIASASPSSSRKRRQIRSQMPACCQSRSRRQQVMPLPQPSSRGRYSQGVPVFRTKRMPSRQLRSGTGGRPPLGLGCCGGMRGSIFSQSASGSSSLAMRSSLTTSETGQRIGRRGYHSWPLGKRRFC